MGDVIIRIGEGAATVLAYLGASALIVAVIGILFPVAAVVVGLCLCGPIGTPITAIMASCGFAGGSKERVLRAESQWSKVRENLERATEDLEYADINLSQAQMEVDDAEPVSDESVGRFQFWGRLKRSKQRFDASMRQNNLDRAKERKKQKEIALDKIRTELMQAERARADAIRSRRRKLLSHTVFTIAIVAVVLWVLYLLPPP